jgi:hypothetical protein
VLRSVTKKVGDNIAVFVLQKRLALRDQSLWLASYGYSSASAGRACLLPGD